MNLDDLFLAESTLSHDVLGLFFLRTKKQKRERTVFLMSNTKEALLHWKRYQVLVRRKKRVDHNESDIVFSHLDDSPIKCFNRAWWSSLKIADIKDFHFHDLRHTFCSKLILSGAGLKEVKEMICHRDISMTDRYSHLTMEHKHQKQLQLSEHYESHATTRG